MRLAFHNPANGRIVFESSPEKVEIREGAFTLAIGGGEGTDAEALRKAFEENPALFMRVEIDGAPYAPWIRVYPAGHTPATRHAGAARLSGAAKDDGGPASVDPVASRWKGWNVANTATAVQAAVLRPADKEEAPAMASDPWTSPAPDFQQAPMLLEVLSLPPSIPVRDMPADDSSPATELRGGEATEINPVRHGSLYDGRGNLYGTTTAKVDDPLADRSKPREPDLYTPALNASWAGINNLAGVYPPDTTGYVGPSHYVQMVNSHFAVYNKTGTLLYGPFAISTLFAGAGAPCQGSDDGDPILIYDQFADRWLLSQFETSSYSVCIAISQTSDPAGAYYRYAVPTIRFPDYYKMGLWPDPQNNAYFMGTNSGFQNQYDVYAIDRERMLTNGTVRAAQAFQNYANLLVPADTDGNTYPPANSPGLFYTIKDGGEPYFNNPATDRIEVYAFDVDWTTPANSTFSLAQSITPADGFANFNWTVCGFFVSNCLPQLGTAVLIDSASWWPMQRLQYRNFGAREALTGAWTVNVNSTGKWAAPRWFELTRSGGAWSIKGQGTHAPDATNRWMGSVALDRDGNLAIGYSATSGTIYPSIRYATRYASDCPGSLQTEVSMLTGTGAQTGSAGRWGDYSSMTVDPADDCTFWYTQEHVPTTSTAGWQTRIGSFTLPACGALRVDHGCDALCGATTPSLAYTVQVDDYRYTGPVTLGVTGCPAGATCTFLSNPVTAPGSTTLTINGLGSVAAGTYTPAVTGTDGSATADLPVRLIVETAPGPFSLSAPADGAANQGLSPTLSWGASASASGYLVEVATTIDFSAIVFSSTVGGTSVTVSPSLSPGTVYYWRVRAQNSCGPLLSSVARFRTILLGGGTPICASPNLAIPDNNATGVNTTLVLPSIGILSDLDISIQANHTWVGDVVFKLTNPALTTTITVFDRPGVPASTWGCGGDNINTRLDDEAALGSVETVCKASAPAIDAGPYTPNNALSAFDGQTAGGTWTLNASDLAAPDAGTVTTWCLIPTVPVTETRASEVSSPISSLPFLVTKNGSNVDLDFQDVGALNYNVYVANNPRNLGLNKFETSGSNGKSLCNVNPGAGSTAGKRVKLNVDPTLGVETGAWFFLVSADNGVALTEGNAGKGSDLLDRDLTLWCPYR